MTAWRKYHLCHTINESLADQGLNNEKQTDTSSPLARMQLFSNAKMPGKDVKTGHQCKRRNVHEQL